MADESDAGDVFYDVARWRLQEQFEQITSLNNRLTTMLAAATTILVLFAALQSLAVGTFPPASQALFLSGLGVYVLFVMVTLSGYTVRRWLILPRLDDLASLLQDAAQERVSDNEVREWTAFAMAAAVAHNRRLIERKSTLTPMAMGLWAIDVLLLALAVATSLPPLAP